MTPLEERNRKKHINAVAKDILCAMLSSPQWWDAHLYKHQETPMVVERAFRMAESFVNRELK